MHPLSFRVALATATFVITLCADQQQGKPLTLAQPTPIAELASSPDQFVGKTIQVKGKITEVCERMGCWTNLVDTASGKAVRVKVADGEIVFPKRAIGKVATAEGKFIRIDLTHAQAVARAQHQAEEQGVSFDPKTVKTGGVAYQLQGVSAVISE
jgi:hypothetical protein